MERRRRQASLTADRAKQTTGGPKQELMTEIGNLCVVCLRSNPDRPRLQLEQAWRRRPTLRKNKTHHREHLPRAETKKTWGTYTDNQGFKV